MILKPRDVGLLLPIVFILLILTANALAEASPESLEILRRIMNAELKVAYAGTRMTVTNTPCGTAVREEAVIHQPPEIHAVTVLSVLEDGRSLKLDDEELHKGSGEKWREGKRGEGLSGRRKFPPRRKRMTTLSQKEVELLAQNYTFDSAVADVIAGQKTDLVTVSPRFEGRPTKRLYLAREKGIILRVEDLDSDGNLRFMSVYTQISFGKETVQQKVAEWGRDGRLPVEKKRRRSEPITLAEAKAVLDSRLIEPTYLPLGFQLLEARYIKHRSETVYLRYTDGMLTFTVFESKGKRARKRTGGREGVQHVQIQGAPVRDEKRGPTHILQWSISDVNFTLMGELGRNELVKIAESLILAAQK